jgi:predicted HD superfamily hydrolase involved in NAD metabolism
VHLEELHLLDGDPTSPLDARRREQVIERLHEYLGKGRVRHVEGVADCAVELAQRFAPELTRRAQVAGLLHDNAKKLTDAQLMEFAARFDIEPTPGELETPQLLHGKVGAALLPERFGVLDAAVAQAIRDHVVGRSGMDTLSQVLYVADQAEPGRDFPGVDLLRAAARRNLGEAVALVARHKIEYVLLKGQWLEPQTVAVWNSYRPVAEGGQE